MSTRESDPWDMGWWRYRIPGLGQVDFRRYVDTLYEGGFDGVLSVEHEDPVWGGTPELIEAGLKIAHNNLRGLVVVAVRKNVLEVRGLVKEYPGVKALQGVDLDVREAEVHCLLGPNGAGKSTLIKCVSGAVEPTSGEILFEGEPLPAGDPAGSLKRGVATIYQELDLVADLSVAESIFLAHEPRRAAGCCSTSTRCTATRPRCCSGWATSRSRRARRSARCAPPRSRSSRSRARCRATSAC